VRQSGCMQDALAQEIKLCPPVHLPLDRVTKYRLVPRCLQRIELESKYLVIGGDPGIANNHAMRRSWPPCAALHLGTSDF